MSGLLTQMTQSSLDRLEQARARESEKALWARVSDMPPAPALRLSPEGFDIIAECKLHSPSAGDLSANTSDVESRVTDYACGGACAVSVLTEPLRFGGQLEHLTRAARVLAPHDVPVMRKDFLVDPYQVMEGRAAGAGGVLVIVRMLDKSRITALLDCAAMLKMFVLLEAFDAADLEVASEVLAQRRGHDEQILVGLNCRDLDKLTVEFSRLSELADSMPSGYPPVAESGVLTPDDVENAVGLGYRVALIGTTLMNSPKPRELLGKMLATGRQTAMSLTTRKLRIAKGEAVEE
ncbi:indole-3-glycerol-phosphate synthase [Steroidobacter sp. S1-65]|uniref:indole-3-glycerol-phosphate synthase n=1 Tax=Steroidobacter gossypii TaxID=2805490 RepID=A0ABS1WTM9_9GAMM|nr:indole-3-glycerol-phosphate synthase [Steroidobacter gossypii]MBM0104303.1 indole-3-glycerol-phosphate synthase [Steroidobacter gossypii]